MKLKATIAALTCSLSLAGWVVAADSPGEHEIPIGEIVGANHVGGRYHFTDKPFLQEGAERVLELGSRTIKLWVNSRPDVNYAFNSDWEASMADVHSVTSLARTAYYREVLELPFKTFFLMTTEFGHTDILDGMSDKERQAVYDEIFEFASYLLTEYKGSGKTFILKNWESDNHIRLFERPESEWQKPIEGMIDWVNTRQRAVSDAREAVGMEGVAVYHAFEVVRIPVRRDFGHPTTLEAVLPETRCDLYSYSNWALNRKPGNEGLLLELLDTIAAITPSSEAFGDRNLFLGEWGTYEVAFMKPQRPDQEGDTRVHDERSDRMQREIVMRNLDLAMGWGIRNALHWQLYGNGLRSGVKLERTEPASEEQLRGVWLIRPGSEKLGVPPSYTSTWDALKELMTQRFLFDDMKAPGFQAGASDNVEFRSDEVDYHPTDPWRVGRVSAGPAHLRYELAGNLRDFNVRILHGEPAGDLIGYWPLNEWDGDHAYDQSGFGNHGTRVGGVGVTDDVAPLDFEPEYAADFDGKGHIAIPASEHFAVREWTLTGWFNVPENVAGDEDRLVISRRGSGAECQFSVGVSARSGRAVVEVSDAGKTISLAVPDEDLRGTGWRFFALVADGGKVQFHLDGVASSASRAVADISAAQPVLIGGGKSGGSWQGKLAEICLYKRAMSQAEISASAAAPAPALSENVRVRVSSDGARWQPFPFRATFTREMNADGVLSTFVRPAKELPPGTRFFEVAWTGDSPEFPEIGSVALRTGDQGPAQK
ncbi:MAG: LamG domain-containing protein [Opitutales bacterium]